MNSFLLMVTGVVVFGTVWGFGIYSERVPKPVQAGGILLACAAAVLYCVGAVRALPWVEAFMASDFSFLSYAAMSVLGGLLAALVAAAVVYRLLTLFNYVCHFRRRRYPHCGNV